MKCKIDTPFIKLDSLLKYAGVADTGGVAKQAAQQGLVLVNGEVETRRGRKIYPGDRVAVDLEEEVVIEVE